MERTDLYQDDLTEERLPTPAQREENSHTMVLDPDVPRATSDPDGEADDDDDDDDEDDDEDEDLDD